MQNLELNTICSNGARHEMEEGAGGGSDKSRRQLMDEHQKFVHSERPHTTYHMDDKDHGKCSEDGTANLDLYSSSYSASPPPPPLVYSFSSQEFNKMISSKLSAYDSASFSFSVVSPPTSLSSPSSSSSSPSPSSSSSTTYSSTDFISTWPLSSLVSPISSSLSCQQTLPRTSTCTMNSSTKSLFCQKQQQPKSFNAVVRLSLFLFLVALFGQQQPMSVMTMVEAHSPPRSQNSLAILGPNSYNYYRTIEKNDSGATENNDSNQGRLTFDRNRLISLLNQRINDRFRNNGLQPKTVNRNPYYKPKPANGNPIDSIGTEPESKSIQYPLLTLLSNQKPDFGVQSMDPYYHYSYYEQMKNRLLAENRQPAISMTADKQQQFPTCKQLRYLWMVKNYFKSLLGDDGSSDSLPSGGDSEIEDYLNKQNNDDIENGIKDGSAAGNDYENGDETRNNQKLVYISKIEPSRDEYNDYANRSPSGGDSVQPLDQPAYGIVRTSPSGSDMGIETVTKAYDQQRRKPTFGEFLEAELSPTTIDSGEQQSDQQSGSGVALARKSPPIIVRPSIKFNMENRAASTKNNNKGDGNGGGSGKNRGNSSDNGKSRSRFSSSQMPGSWHNKPVIPSVRIIS